MAAAWGDAVEDPEGAVLAAWADDVSDGEEDLEEGPLVVAPPPPTPPLPPVDEARTLALCKDVATGGLDVYGHALVPAHFAARRPTTRLSTLFGPVPQRLPVSYVPGDFQKEVSKHVDDMGVALERASALTVAHGDRMDSDAVHEATLESFFKDSETIATYEGKAATLGNSPKNVHKAENRSACGAVVMERRDAKRMVHQVIESVEVLFMGIGLCIRT